MKQFKTMMVTVMVIMMVMISNINAEENPYDLLQDAMIYNSLEATEENPYDILQDAMIYNSLEATEENPYDILQDIENNPYTAEALKAMIKS